MNVAPQDGSGSGLDHSPANEFGPALPRPAARETLAVGGLERFSLVDWPGMITATVFCQGCGWRCRYCHNPHLRAFAGRSMSASGVAAKGATEGADGWTWPGVLAWLRDRRGLLDGVVFSGGEPTLQRDLRAAMGQVRELGFRLGLHTAGPDPGALAAVLPLVEWVGFDFKAPFADYGRVTRAGGGEAAARSFALVQRAGVAFEIRTTWHPELLSEIDLHVMADTLAASGVATWVVQRFRAGGCADQALCATPLGAFDGAALARPGLVVRVR